MNKKIEICENQEFLPKEVAESEKAQLDTAQKNLLGTLCFYYLNHSVYADKHEGWFFKDQATLFKESNLSMAEGKRVLLKLIFKRLIERASGTKGKCTYYRLNKGIMDLMPKNPEVEIIIDDDEKIANEPLEQNRLVEYRIDETSHRIEEEIEDEDLLFEQPLEGCSKTNCLKEAVRTFEDEVRKAKYKDEVREAGRKLNAVKAEASSEDLYWYQSVKEQLNDLYSRRLAMTKNK